jgi:Rrf2 family transcriptional regulator, cysteine metabolism repressor
MKISTKIRYGTRAILELAVQYGKGPVELREIATKEGISLKYLEQVIIPLRTGGLVKSIRGSRGGYTLAKPPSRIRLSEVVGVLEGPFSLTECLQDPTVCQKVSVCVTRDVWKKVSDAINGILTSITLEEMVNRRKEKEGPFRPTYEI